MARIMKAYKNKETKLVLHIYVYLLFINKKIVAVITVKLGCNGPYVCLNRDVVKAMNFFVVK